MIVNDADWIESSIYEEYLELEGDEEKTSNIIHRNDVLLASTGDGTLGKCCVYDIDTPAIADSHVTIIRVNSSIIDPFYLADYLRIGFGSKQINRLYTGSTGLIELTPEQVNSIIVDLKSNVAEQKNASHELRTIEKNYLSKLSEADEMLLKAQAILME